MPATDDRAAASTLQSAPFMRACRGETAPITPVWLMRQAGRSQASYRRLREQYAFSELIRTPELAAQITVDAVQELGVDAAIQFADILPLLQSLGFELEYPPDAGPLIHNPLRTGREVDALSEANVRETQGFVFEAIRLARAALPNHVPLIGFSGAPFTLAAYAIEGGASKNFARVKAFMLGDPGAWSALLERLSRAVTEYLHAQIDAGVQVLQLFDTWVGCLSPADYRRFVLPATRRIFAALRGRVPLIYFGVGTATLLPDMLAAGPDVIGLDWRVPLGETWTRLGATAVQGNLDPCVLLAGRETVRERAREILDAAAGRPGHIFNLGHGVLPQTPADSVRALVDFVHEATQA